MKNRLEQFRRNFLWGEIQGDNIEKRTLHLLNWNAVCSSKMGGGLGIQRIKERNLAFLGKWWWKFQVERDKKWNRLLRSKYGVVNSLAEIQVKKLSPIMRDILSVKKSHMYDSLFHDSCWRWKIKDGYSVFFWHDDWAGDGPLKLSFHRLFSLCIDKSISLEGMYSCLNDNRVLKDCLWRRKLRGWECESLHDLTEILRKFVPTTGNDQVLWSPNAGIYSVKEAYHLLVKCEPSRIIWSTIWSLIAPAKVKFLLWKIEHNIVPTKRFLQNRIKKGDGVCEWCGTEFETCSHIFWECQFVKSVWRELFRWWNVNVSHLVHAWGSLSLIHI